MQRFIMRENDFDLEFLTVNQSDAGKDGLFWPEMIGDGYVLQQRMIVPSHLPNGTVTTDISI
jgi:hypothetical protein